MTPRNIGSFRWRILALLFMATTINYMDRSVLGVLGPTLRDHVFGWTNRQYAYITISFKIAYALGLLVMGAVVDRKGAKKGYLYSIGTWSVFSLLHALVTRGMGWIGFAAVRFGLGFGESGNFPSCIKTIAEWFPKKERALATGIFNAGTNVGVILSALLVTLIVSPEGKRWQFAFLVTSVFSATWVLLWVRTYRRPEAHPGLRRPSWPSSRATRPPRPPRRSPGPRFYPSRRPGPSPWPSFRTRSGSSTCSGGRSS
jgi:ACS family hexuronate transporter-like MFS transporter